MIFKGLSAARNCLKSQRVSLNKQKNIIPKYDNLNTVCCWRKWMRCAFERMWSDCILLIRCLTHTGQHLNFHLRKTGGDQDVNVPYKRCFLDLCHLYIFWFESNGGCFHNKGVSGTSVLSVISRKNALSLRTLNFIDVSSTFHQNHFLVTTCAAVNNNKSLWNII